MKHLISCRKIWMMWITRAVYDIISLNITKELQGDIIVSIIFS
jgi:hypothetical protein